MKLFELINYLRYPYFFIEFIFTSCEIVIPFTGKFLVIFLMFDFHEPVSQCVIYHPLHHFLWI